MTKGQAVERVTLSDAIAAGDLEIFIRQAEAETVAVDREEFEARLGRLIKAPPPVDRTSRSPARGGSRGTQTR